MTTVDWAELVSDVLAVETERTGKPVPGAKLRALLARKAQQIGVTIPDEQPFADFLASVAPDATIVRQRGSDMLVLPKDRPALMPRGPDFHIRKDLFDAFTIVNQAASPWYDRDLDRVFWRPANSVPMSAAVQIPPSTSESEIEVRRAFAKQLDSETAVEVLEVALNDALPFRSFSQAVVRLGLVQRWHAFRGQAVRTRLENWARQNSIAWRDAWLIPRRERTPTAMGRDTAMGLVDEKNAILAVLNTLNIDELRRILVPLDVAARLRTRD